MCVCVSEGVSTAMGCLWKERGWSSVTLWKVQQHWRDNELWMFLWTSINLSEGRKCWLVTKSVILYEPVSHIIKSLKDMTSSPAHSAHLSRRWATLLTALIQIYWRRMSSSSSNKKRHLQKAKCNYILLIITLVRALIWCSDLTQPDHMTVCKGAMFSKFIHWWNIPPLPY